MTATASERPRFDFDGALELARELHHLACYAEEVAKGRALDRDASLEEWLGNVGQQFAARATDEDSSVRNAVLVLKSDAWEWTRLWGDMVDDMNRVLYAEAHDAQVRYLRRKAEESFGLDDVVAGATGVGNVLFDIARNTPLGRTAGGLVDRGSGVVGDGLGWLTSPEDDAFRFVDDPPELLALPEPPGFQPAGGVFAAYYRDGDRLRFRLVPAVPAPLG